jgi:ABC-type polysaccharide/polyol phosphate transport system ATPase subunit
VVTAARIAAAVPVHSPILSGVARPIVIEARSIHKEFHIPGRGQVSGRHRMTHPLARARGRQLRVLEDISFDIHKGEFFGIVGRNGSGKSTLLKLLASIYAPDRGSIRIAGRLAPFIEVGVGFHPDLAAYDNVLLNGVMMGLTPREARRRSDQIVEFAGLQDFTDLKLRNYSSGMRVRLGFSVMAHVDADVLLIDEVLAVGDAAFQEKCAQVFDRMHQEGKTIVLVTHSMPSINLFCDRAMLLHDGNVESIGQPEKVANRYLDLNHSWAISEASLAADPSDEVAGDGKPAHISELRLVGSGGVPMSPTVLEGESLELTAVVEVSPMLEQAGFGFQVYDETGRLVYVSPVSRFGDSLSTETAADERLHVRATIENHLGVGQYMVSCGVMEIGDDQPQKLASQAMWANFQVLGDGDRRNLVSLDHDVSFEREADRPVVSG